MSLIDARSMYGIKTLNPSSFPTENVFIPLAPSAVFGNHSQSNKRDQLNIKLMVKIQVPANSSQHFTVCRIVHMVFDSLTKLSGCFSHIEGSTFAEHKVYNTLCITVRKKFGSKHFSSKNLVPMETHGQKNIFCICECHIEII